MRSKTGSVFDFLPETPATSDDRPAPSAPTFPSPRGWHELDPEGRARALLAIRTAHEDRDFNTATALLVALVGGDEARAHFAEMLAIDERAAARGYVTERDIDRRVTLTTWALDRLGFDPRRQDGPRLSVVRAAPAVRAAPSVPPTPPVVTAVRVAVRAAPAEAMPPARAQPLALTEGLAAPLQAGDWAELWRRVEAGAISQQDAEHFGAIWRSGGLPQ